MLILKKKIIHILSTFVSKEDLKNQLQKSHFSYKIIPNIQETYKDNLSLH